MRSSSRSRRRPRPEPARRRSRTTKTTYAVVPIAGQTSTPTLHHDPTTGNAGLLDAYKGKLPNGWKILKVPSKTTIISCSAETTTVCPGDTNATGLPPAGSTDYYLFKHGSYPNDRYATDGKFPNMTGNELNLSGVRQDFDPSTGQPVVLLAYKGDGNKAFLQVTKNEAIRGQTLGLTSSNASNQCGAPCAFAIVLDNQIRSWPAIRRAARTRAASTRAGTARRSPASAASPRRSSSRSCSRRAPCPVKFVTVEQTDVSATLGKDSLKQAQNAAIGGLIVVALFLLLFYRFLGLVAVLGLGIYAAFMYAAILLFGVTLTLPGFAGLILTIGVAADANVVIFERIKEEARTGKSVRAAVAAGYAKGFRTIVDANVVTAITALILFAVASADVKGFALMLLIGTVVSMITAVAATRAMLGLLAGFRWFSEPELHGRAPLAARLVPADRLHGPDQAVVLDLGRHPADQHRLARRARPEPRHRLQGRRPDHVHHCRSRRRCRMSATQAKAIGQGDAVVQGRGKSTNGDELQELPDRPEEALAGGAVEPDETTCRTTSRR